MLLREWVTGHLRLRRRWWLGRIMVLARWAVSVSRTVMVSCMCGRAIRMTMRSCDWSERCDSITSFEHCSRPSL